MKSQEFIVFFLFCTTQEMPIVLPAPHYAQSLSIIYIEALRRKSRKGSRSYAQSVRIKPHLKQAYLNKAGNM